MCKLGDKVVLKGSKVLASAFLILSAAIAFSQQSATSKQPVVLTVTSEPNAIVWVDDIRRGVTDAQGKLRLTKLKPGRHAVRVRANGFKETTAALLPGRREISVKLVPTSNEAELTFQQAESAREKARDDAALQQAAELYRKALSLRPNFPEAHVGLARVLLDLNEFNAALGEIAAARKTRRIYPEASAVEGRINHEAAFDDEAVRSFRRSIQEARGFQPEAHVGLARVLEEKGQNAEAIAAYRKAIDQLSESEPVIYQMLGAAYEKTQQYKEAVGAYEKYLQLAPNSNLAPAVRSIVDQLKRGEAGEDVIPCCD